MEVTKRLAGQSAIVYDICTKVLGPVGGILAMLGVIACPITSGDTAFRSARLTIADWLNIDQKPHMKRLLISVPLLLTGAAISQINFQIIWRYFSWSNQTLAMMVLWAAAVFLCKNKRNFWVAAVPATFMSAVSCTYILVAGEGFGPMIARMLSGGTIPAGASIVGVASAVAYPVGLLFAAGCFGMFYAKCVKANTSK